MDIRADTRSSSTGESLDGPRGRVYLACLTILALLVAVAWLPSEVLGGAWASAPLGEAPLVSGVSPSSAPNDLDTPIVISGTGFAATLSDTSVLTAPTILLDDTPLADVGWISSTLMTATVPWGLDAGTHALVVTNPDGASGSLDEAITVTEGIGVWTTGGPYGGAVTTLLVHPLTTTTLYATVSAAGSGAGIGLFRSADGGSHWELIAPNIGSRTHEADLSSLEPNLIYLHSWDDGLVRSDDGGDHWTSLPFPYPICGALKPYASPVDPQQVLVASDCSGFGGLYRSDDRGATWITRTHGLTDTQVTALAFDPTDPQVMVVGTDNGNVFRSVDAGSSWSPLGKPDAFIGDLAINPFGEHEIWAAGADGSGHWGHLWRYTLGHWTQVLPGVDMENEATRIVFSPEVSGTMWIGALGGALVSGDGGEAWEPFSSTGYQVTALAIDPTSDAVAYLGFNGTGIAKTTDGGASWAEADEGLAGVYPNGLAVDPGNPARIYATAHGVGTFVSNNGGGSWLRLPLDDLLPRAPLIDPHAPERTYVCSAGHVSRTDDGGATWESAHVPAPPLAPITWGVQVLSLRGTGQPGVLILGAGLTDADAGNFELVGGAIYRSTDYGASWSAVDLGQEIGPVGVLAPDPSDPATIYAGAGRCCEDQYSGVWKSQDDGVTWTPSGLSGVPITGLAVDPTDPETVYAVSYQQFHVSEDGGSTWALRASMATEDYGIDRLLVVPNTPSLLYLHGWRGVLRSIDGGRHWERAAGALGSVNVGAMTAAAVDGRVIVYTGTGGGVAAVQTSSLTGDSMSSGGDVMRAGVHRRTSLPWDRRLYAPFVRP